MNNIVMKLLLEYFKNDEFYFSHYYISRKDGIKHYIIESDKGKFDFYVTIKKYYDYQLTLHKFKKNLSEENNETDTNI